MLFQRLLTLIYLPYICFNFSFKQLTVGPGTSVIGVITTYDIIYERSITNTNSITNWSSQAVPASSTITVTFPSDYTLSSPTCVAISINSVTVAGFSCANSGNTVTVSNAIPSAQYIDRVELTIGNIVNPVPAIYTGQFNGLIGTDVSVPVGGGVQLQAAAFDSCSVTFDAAVVNQTSTLVLTLDPKNSLSSSATILISTPRHYTNDILTTSQLPVASSMVCANYSSGVATTPTCAGNTVLFTITASNLLTATTSTSFSFGVKSMVSPPTLQPSDSFTITSYIGSYQVDTCTVYATGLIANTLTSVVITPLSTMTVNTNVGLRFDLTLADFCNEYDDLQITFPSQILPTFVNVSGSGIYNSTTSGVSGQVLSVINRRTIAKLYSKGSVYTINFYQIKAPPSTKTTSSITVKIIRNGYDKMTGSATIQAVSSTLTGTVIPTLFTVNKVTTYGINITITDGLSPTGMVKIVFPTTITLTITTGCATLVGTSVKSSPTCAYDSTTNTVLISSMNSSSSNIPAQTLKFTILGVKNPPSVNPSGSFSVTTYYTTDTSGVVSVGTLSGITATLDIIDASKVSVVPSSVIVSDTSVTYTLNFVNGNSIPQNGYAQINIPSGVTLNVGSITSYCQLSLGGGAFFSTTCAGVTTGSGYYVNFSSIAQSTTISSGTTIALRISSLFTNPSDTSIVSTFTIKTYHSDTYGIEQLTTGISVQMITASTFTAMSVSRTSDTNSDPTAAYTFKLKQTPNLPASAKLKITYPSSITLTGTTACTSLTSVSLTCVQSTGSIQIQLISAVSSGTQFGVTLSNIINPPSFAPLSSAFTFLTTSSDRLLSYATGTLTSSLQDSVPSSFASLSGQFSSRIYGESTNLQITVTPSSRMVPSYMLVTVASTFTVSTLSCPSWSCTSMSSNVIKINSITSTAQISFTITGITAPKSAPSDYTKVSSYDSGDFLIDQNSATIIFSTICAMPCRTCSVSNTSSCITCYSDTAITTSIYFYSTTSLCYYSCPTYTYTDSSIYKCINCSSICLTCTGTSTNCTSCLSNSTYPYLFVNSSVGTCRTQCPTSYYPDTSQNPIVCVLCISPCSACTSSSQCTSCVDDWYFYNNTCSTSCPSGTTIPNNSTNTCDGCSAQCAMCSVTVSTCRGCATGAALYNETCVTVCPTPYVIYNGECVTCSTNCLTCSLTYSNCTSCSTSSSFPYLYNNTCLANCPELYYPSISSGQCILCSTLNMGCDNCTSTSTCGTCNWNQGFVFLSNRCFSITPVGYYNSSGYALPCDSTKDCATCLNLAQNCTACTSLNLQGNLCVSQCRAGFVGINQTCVACTGSCKTCSNLQSNCTSCLPSLNPPVYLTNYQCLTTCPDYTYPNSTTSQCTNCISPCQKCTSASSCNTCLSGFFLYNNSCEPSCPYGYFGVNRFCVRCTSPCDACSLSLTLCTACVTNYYLVSSTSTCVNPCPTGLYPNSGTGSCTGCVTPCSTCSTTASTCTSCLNSLNLFNGTCVPDCPDGYYLLNSQCNSCNVNCTRCTSSSVCQACVFGLYLFNGNCISSCPSTSPVTTTGSCTPCTDANCLVCNNLDQCSSCNYPTLLLLGDCLNSCPTDYVSNTTHCNYSPTPNTTNTTENSTNTTLNSTLSSSNIFPVPFTIAASFIGIACIMSKFQHPYTFISGSLYSLWSVLQWGSIGVGGYLYYLTNKDSIAFTSTYIQAFVFIGAVGFMYFLNLLALISQTCFLKGQEGFRRWQDKEGSNSCFYTFSTIFGAIITHKFKNIMFCKLFGFDIFKARLNNVQSFRIFNIFSFLSIIPSAAILFSTSYMIYKHQITDQQLMGYIDILVLTTACIILSIFNSRKDQDFFQEKDEDGIIINKRIIQSDSIMQEAIIPFMADDAMQQRGGNLKNNFESERRFKSFQKSYQTISDAPSQQQFNYIAPPKSVHNISIQAAPVLQDYSKIDFYNDEQLSDMSMFRKVDKSINMTKQLNANQVSVQNDMNIFDQKQISIQHNPQQDDISVQHQVDVRDISLQHAPNMDDHGMQMSRQEEDHSIQVGVLVHNASIQYSAKPVFQDISQDFVDQQDEQQEGTNNSKLENELTGIQKPSQNPQGLKAELQLDVDEKLRQRQQQMQMQRQLEIARKKQEMLKKFHEQQQKKLLKKQTPASREDQFDNVNNMYNNENSRADGSSLMDSNANIMVHFKNNSKKNIVEQSDEPISNKPSKQISNKSKLKQPQQERFKPEERAQSAKTEKQLIQLLSNNNNQQQGGLDLQSSMSFNVTRDLQSGNQNGRRIKNVVYEEQDKDMDSGGEEDIELESPQRNKKKQVYILQNDTNQQIPSGIQKSRSTNFLSTNGGRRPPLPNRGGSKYLLDDTMNMQNSHAADQYQQINYHPIKPVARHAIPTSNYKEEDLDYQAKTNLNQFYDRRKNNPVSAQLGKNKFQSVDSGQLSSNSKEIKQNPLPLPKIERLKSQQSNHSYDNSERLYKMNTRKALIEDRKLQFDDEQKIDLEEDYESQQKLPPVSGLPQPKLRKIRSQTKMAERDNSYEKPVHRQLLGKERYADRTQKYLQKEYKKAQNTKKKIQMMEVMLQRPNITNDRGYLKQTYSSQDKKKKSQLQKVYMNNPFEKRN